MMNWIIGVLGWFGITTSLSVIKYTLWAILGGALFVGGCSLGTGSVQSRIDKAHKTGYNVGYKEGIRKGYDVGYSHGKEGRRKLAYPELWMNGTPAPEDVVAEPPKE